ncbi:bifunctional riboflavin kinase/FAD synthetase [Candidatus Desantisbacteria bacterium]|nr:bifunctional riboflavin kinase/FAD synthetase [Candidatus Desantisbacteria bacterium]
MNVIHEISSNTLKCQSSVVTVGIFDGVHLGHQKIIAEVVESASMSGAESVVMTFDPHPEEVILSKSPPFLLPLGERIRLIEEMGVSLMIISDFTTQIADISAEEFVRDILVDRLRTSKICVGYDYGFGKDRTGGIELLRELGHVYGFETEVVPPVKINNEIVSSTKIRCCIAQGKIAQANDMLGRKHTIKVSVVHGDKRGRILGYPTANCLCKDDILLPCVGVYAARVWIDNIRYNGMANIGYCPTFRGEELRFEVHLLDFQGDLYGRELMVTFIDRIRDERVFDGMEELLEQLRKDEGISRKMLDDR